MAALLNGLFSLVLEGYILSTGYPKINVWTMIECADLCLAETSCVAFSHKKSGLCQLSSSRDTTRVIQEGASDSGMRFYVIHKDSCPMHMGYSLSMDPALCYKIGSEKKSHHHAVTACKSDGGFLIRIDSQKKQDFTALLHQEMPSNSRPWIDGSDKDMENVWRFSDGTLMTYTKWSQKLRSQCDDDDDCVQLRDENSKWFDTNCDLKHRYICEIPTT